MCNPGDRIRLCTCPDAAVPKDSSKRHQVQWTLRRRTGTRDVVGRVAIPSEQIGKNLSLERIENNLNSSNCFDFEYSPEEGDTLILSSTLDVDDSFLYLEFANGSWSGGSSNAWDIHTTLGTVLIEEPSAGQSIRLTQSGNNLLRAMIRTLRFLLSKSPL